MTVSHQINEPKEANKQPWVVNAIGVVVAHFLALGAFAFVKPMWQTSLFGVILFTLATFGITFGYHRLWSHRAFDAVLPLRIIVACMGTMAFQGSIKWWALRHRLHHRYTDTDSDPYNAKRGFFFSHIGWIFEKPHYDRIKLIDQSDLKSDPVVVFQHKYFPILAMISSLIVPAVVANYAWNESWVAALLYAGIVKTIVVWHATFCINSLAHAVGEQQYSLDCTAKGGLLLAIITLGEGYHNYHHAFPRDVRNGIMWYQYDPTKWAIFFFSYFGMTYNLHTVTDEDIERERIHVLEHVVEERRKAVSWGMPENDMTVFTMDQVQSCRENGRELFVIDGFVIDVSKFKTEHPGGVKYISTHIGRDATQSFYGKLNNHTTAAHTLLRTLAIGTIPDKRCDSHSSSKEE